MLALLFPARRRRGVRPVREMLSAEALEQRLALAAATLNTINVVNQSGLDPTKYTVWVAGFMKDASDASKWRILQADGSFSNAAPAATAPFVSANGGLSIQVPDVTNSGTNRLVFTVTTAGTTPPAFGTNGAPNNGYTAYPFPGVPGNAPAGPYDIFEFGPNAQYDVSAVDSFGMNLSFQVAGDPLTYGPVPTVTRSKIGTAFTQFTKTDPHGPAFSQLLYTSPTGAGYPELIEGQFSAIVSPKDWLAIYPDAPGLDGYWTDTVNAFFKNGNQLNFYLNGAVVGTYSGSSDGTAYTLSGPGGTYSVPQSDFSGNQPFIQQVNTTDTTLGQIYAALFEAFSRGVALDGVKPQGQPITASYSSDAWTNTANWYATTNNTYNGAPRVYDAYAKFFHLSSPEGTVDGSTIYGKNPSGRFGMAYGFSLDENPNVGSTTLGIPTNAWPNSLNVPSKKLDVVTTQTVTLTVGPWGEASKVSVNAPTSFTVVENSKNNPFQWPASPVPFADTAATSLTVTLSVTGGTLALAPASGLTIGGTAAAPTISGPITALNTYFTTQGNVRYTPIPGSLAPQFLTTSAADSLGNTNSAISSIDIVSTNGPVVTAPPVFTVNENTATSLIWQGFPPPFADVSSSNLTVTLSVTGGTVAFNAPAATAAGLIIGTSPAGPTIRGAIATLNTYFQNAGNVTYTPITGSVVPQTLTTKASDGSESGQAKSLIQIIARTPGVPTVTLTPGVFTTAVNTPVGLQFTGTPFADAAATPTTVFTVTMSTIGVGNGTLAAAPGSGVTVVTSAGEATFTGTLSALNAYFTSAPAKITYTPPKNVQGTRTLSTVIAGIGKTSQPASTTIVIGTNVAPTIAAPIAFWVPEQGRTNLVWPRGLAPFADRDSRTLTVTLSTDSPSVGSFTGSRADRTVTVVATGSFLEVTGRPADLNRYFATAGRITYTAIGPSLQPRVLTVRASDGGAAGVGTSAILVRARGPLGVPAINRSATLGSTPAGTPLVITYAQLVAATGATTANSRSVEFLLGGVSSGRLELWDGAKWVRVPATLPTFKEPILAPGGLIRWTPPARATGQRPAFRAIAWDGWKMSAIQSQVTVDVT